MTSAVLHYFSRQTSVSVNHAVYLQQETRAVSDKKLLLHACRTSENMFAGNPSTLKEPTSMPVFCPITTENS